VLSTRLRARFGEAVLARPGRLRAYVLVKAGFVAIVLLVLWAIRDKDLVVVYMKF
jgi:hypothetical protein